MGITPLFFQRRTAGPVSSDYCILEACPVSNTRIVYVLTCVVIQSPQEPVEFLELFFHLVDLNFLIHTLCGGVMCFVELLHVLFGSLNDFIQLLFVNKVELLSFVGIHAFELLLPLKIKYNETF